MSKHTPLPWIRGDYEDHSGYDGITGAIEVGPCILDAKEYGQLRCWDDDPWDRERMEADADLIASIGDVLDALQHTLTRCDSLIARFNGARNHRLDAAVGKEIVESIRAELSAAIAKATGEA